MANLSEQRPLLEPTGAGPVTGPSERSTWNAEAAPPAGPIGEPSNVQLAVVMGSIWVSRSPRHNDQMLMPSRLVFCSHQLASKLLNLQNAIPSPDKSLLVNFAYSQTRPSLPRSLSPSHPPSPR